MSDDKRLTDKKGRVVDLRKRPGRDPYIKVAEPGSVGEDPRLNRLRMSTQALAAEPDAQLAIYPDFVAKVDELALDYNHWLETCVPLLSEEHKAVLRPIDDLLDEMSGPDGPWDEHALRTDQRWQRVRAMANEALQSLGWPKETPLQSPDTFVKFDK